MGKSSQQNQIRVRIPPSPTGFLHIGNARTVLYNWLFARNHGGQFFLRIEDTDRERYKKEYEDDILESLKWLGLNWDNEEIIKQSERMEEYKKYLALLLDSGKAFWCDHSKEELEAEQRNQMANKEAPRHVCSHKRENRSSGQVIRLSVDENSTREIIFEDQIRGPVAFKESLLGDISIARNLDSALYHFAVVVDDIDMAITHVIRGEDHISNTPKQILIYESLDEEIPLFGHVPLILAPDRSKLSKRHGATAVRDYKKDYLPGAMINFLGFLGYTFSKEIVSKEEMAEEFKLEKVHKSGAVFDVKKLNWINAQYIRQLSLQEFRKLTNNYLITNPAMPLITERLEKLGDVDEFSYLWSEPVYNKDLLLWKGASFNEVKSSLEACQKTIESAQDLDKEKLRNELDKIGSEIGNRGLVYWPLRVALSGKEKSPDPVEIADVLGKAEVIKRIKKAISLI